ncbi:MAG TPA: hypothetical protein PLV42_00110 [bacterium]|nr:hypothetical protein [bacterium]
MRKAAILVCSLLFALVSCSTKHDAQKLVEKYFDLIKGKNYEAAWELVDEESKKEIEQELWMNDVRQINSLSMFLKFQPTQINKEETKVVIFTEFTGAKEAMNKLPGAQIKFYAVKNGDQWQINLRERLEELKKQREWEAIEIPIDETLINNAKQYKDKILVENVRNGAVQYENGLEQYMMDATITNKSDKPFSYIGVAVKFMDDTNTKVLMDKVFFLIYTRQVQGIYPLKPGEKRDVIIPGYAAEDVFERTGVEWTGKLQWEVEAVKIATPEEMIELE